jgi:hypothetical protein
VYGGGVSLRHASPLWLAGSPHPSIYRSQGHAHRLQNSAHAPSIVPVCLMEGSVEDREMCESGSAPFLCDLLVVDRYEGSTLWRGVTTLHHI